MIASMRTAMLLMLASLAIGAGSLSAEKNTQEIFPGGAEVSDADLGGVMCREWVELTTADESRVVRLWDIDLAVDSNSRILLGTSSEAIFALTLNGQCRVGRKNKAEAGQIMVWSHYGGGGVAPLVYSFSAERLLDSFLARGLSTDSDLTTLAKVQKKKMFWGKLRATDYNVASPVPGELEALRENYQTNTEVIGIKRASRNKADYAAKTAERFLELLGQGNADAAGLLISPSLFLEGAPAEMTEHLLAKQRVAFARSLVDSGDYGGIGAVRIKHLGEGRFSATAGEHRFLISLQPYDDGLYVSSLKHES